MDDVTIVVNQTQTAQLMFDHFFAKANEWMDIAAGLSQL